MVCTMAVAHPSAARVQYRRHRGRSAGRENRIAAAPAGAAAATAGAQRHKSSPTRQLSERPMSAPKGESLHRSPPRLSDPAYPAARRNPAFSFQMVFGVHAFMIGLLIDHHPVEPQGFSSAYSSVASSCASICSEANWLRIAGKVLTEIIHSHLALMFAGHQQQMLKAQVTDRGALAGNLGGIQRLARLISVAHREAAWCDR